MPIKKWMILLLGWGTLGVGLALLAAWTTINYTWAWLPTFAVELAREPELLKRPEAKRCGDCHQEIFEAWKESRHAKAWISEGYIKDSENRTKEKCLPCHAPTEVHPLKKPDPRLDLRDEGIYCVPCHVKEDGMHGPHHLFAPPHPTVHDQDYNASKFCGACHEKTYDQWTKTGQRDTCQSCHMPRTRKRLTQKPPLSWFHTEKWVGDHRFLHGEFEANTLRVQMDWSEAFATVSLTNVTVPHHVPTADNGDPRLYLEVEFRDTQGKPWDTLKEILAPQQDSALPWNQPVTYRYRIPGEIRQATVTLRYRPAWSKEKSDIFTERFERPKTG